MNELSPCIGERYRDTGRDIGNITHLARFRDARRRDEEREEIAMRALIQKARRIGATLEQIEQARTAALAQLRLNRSIASAIQCAEQHLPRKPTPPLAG